ncbi:hypothetical protein M3P05_13235 [Sansalvadorimonas sp. 2012CJ34-2]|uniref:Uncharacterized protein n=1 Tax=Parendozoicomonas callyspongiae TaxID=2942213 RepID=A0ABT0PHM5_9GAMM|nr:hypothetical protein [Sansalvadorimonas sp. 2012CJ34-2]MCL6270887.1 hypothetical protein [Sansalvadorimonas sp. 2012CJ34-2]
MPHGKLLLACLMGLSTTTTMAAPVGQTTCFNFTEKNWSFLNNNFAKGWPKVLAPGELELLPDNMFGAGVAAVLRNSIRPPYEVSFEFSTYDDDGGKNLVWNSADGIAFFFLKSGESYGEPPAGNQMGFSRNGGGYAITMPTYGQRRATFRTSDGLDHKVVPFRQAYTHGEWVPVRIQVMPNRVIAWGGKWGLIDATFNFDMTYNDLGFSAATGRADGLHKIRNFCIRTLDSLSVRQERAPVEEKPESRTEPPAPIIPPQLQTEETEGGDLNDEESLLVPIPSDSSNLSQTLESENTEGDQ